MPTKVEEELMNKWLDEYKFSMEVIEEAFAKSIRIKSPNMKYVDGILRNWHEKTLDLNLEKREEQRAERSYFIPIESIGIVGVGEKEISTGRTSTTSFFVRAI